MPSTYVEFTKTECALCWQGPLHAVSHVARRSVGGKQGLRPNRSTSPDLGKSHVVLDFSPPNLTRISS